MPTFAVVACVFAIVLGFWILGAYNRLVRYRNEVSQTFAKLREQLARRHRLVQDLIDRATALAIDDPRVRLKSIAATLDTARIAADHAKAAPQLHARVSAVDRSETALTRRLDRLLTGLGTASAGHDDDEVQRLREELDRGAAQLDFAIQAFNQAALAYNRAAREAPTHAIARTFGFGEASVVSPGIGKVSAARHSATPKAGGLEEAAPAASADAASAAAAASAAPAANTSAADRHE